MNNKEMSIQEIADALGITYFAARQRIVRAKIKPVVDVVLYPANTLEIIRNTPGRGRPRIKDAPAKTKKARKV